MGQSPSWEAKAGQQIPTFRVEQKIYHLFYKTPTLVLILSQINPVHFPSFPLKTHFNNTLTQLRFGLIFRFPHQKASTFRHTCHMPHPSHSSWFDNPNNIWRGAEITKSLLTWRKTFLSCILSLRSKYFPKNRNSRIPLAYIPP
jgi:hypothetical protein